jgi:hypothetical protein
MSTADISSAVTPYLQRKTLASSGYKSQRMYCTKEKKRTTEERKKKTEGEGNVRKRETEGGRA